MNLTSWNQNAWCALCQSNEAGVCRALVLIWLYLRGDAPPPNPTDPQGAMFTRLLQRIMGANLATFGVNVLEMQWKGPQELLPKILPKVKIVEYVLEMTAWPARFLIGIGTDTAGHAIGLVLSQNIGHFFDPNTGYGSGAPHDVVDHAMTKMLVHAKNFGAEEISVYRFWA